MPYSFHKEIEWMPNRMQYGNYLFRLEHFKNEPWSSGEEYFTFYKVRELVDEYGDFFSRIPEFRCQHLLEIGVFKGGSMPFWNEIFKPSIHVGIDLCEITVSGYLEDYIRGRSAEGRDIRYFSGVDQADKDGLVNLVNMQFPGTLDLVIDDASHLYGPSKASFEAVFPRLRPGGLYIIEDWAWGHWSEFFGKDHFWAHEMPPTRLISELVEFTGSDRKRDIIRSLAVYEGFVVIERGPHDFKGSRPFVLADFIRRKPFYPKPNPVITRLKSAVKKVIARGVNNPGT